MKSTDGTPAASTALGLLFPMDLSYFRYRHQLLCTYYKRFSPKPAYQNSLIIFCTSMFLKVLQLMGFPQIFNQKMFVGEQHVHEGTVAPLAELEAQLFQVPENAVQQPASPGGDQRNSKHD